MPGLPFANILHGDTIVRVPFNLSMNVKHHERQEHVLDRDLINRAQSLDKMRRRITVRSPLADELIGLCREPVSARALAGCVAVDALTLLVGKTGPMGNAGFKRVRKIDELLLAEYRVDLLQRPGSWRNAAGNEESDERPRGVRAEGVSRVRALLGIRTVACRPGCSPVDTG